jgi:hypothetical protein
MIERIQNRTTKSPSGRAAALILAGQHFYQ